MFSCTVHVLLKAIHLFTIYSSSGCIIRNHSGCTILSCSGRDPVRGSECTSEEGILLEMKLGALLCYHRFKDFEISPLSQLNLSPLSELRFS
jgi:hypothetical protein